jgi:hypothetical protein
MKLISPCCKVIKDFNPQIPWDGKTRKRVKCRECRKLFTLRKEHIIHHGTEPKGSKSAPITVATIPPLIEDYKDDPDELLHSLCVRELNKPNPDVRWASILLTLLKERGKRASEMSEQFRQLPSTTLIQLLKTKSARS